VPPFIPLILSFSQRVRNSAYSLGCNCFGSLVSDPGISESNAVRHNWRGRLADRIDPDDPAVITELLRLDSPVQATGLCRPREWLLGLVPSGRATIATMLTGVEGAWAGS
jgi:hypothetical protein